MSLSRPAPEFQLAIAVDHQHYPLIRAARDAGEGRSDPTREPRGCEEPIIRFSLLGRLVLEGKVAKNHMAYPATVQRSTEEPLLRVR
jgi:hypothetical protein